MKIENALSQQAYAAYRTAPEPARDGNSASSSSEAVAPKAQQPDTVQLSEQSKRYAQALEAVKSTPQVREDLVSSLKTQVQNGTYTVDAQALAGAIQKHVNVLA